jgi:hypothetical protein
MTLEKAANHGDTADTANNRFKNINHGEHGEHGEKRRKARKAQKSGEKQKICFCFSPCRRVAVSPWLMLLNLFFSAFLRVLRALRG